MAKRGKPIGEMVIDLNLDPTQYNNSQKQIMANAKEVTGSIDKQWKLLGSKTDAYFEAMEKGFRSTHQKIINTGFQTTDTITRSYQLMEAKILELDKERYAHKYKTLEATKAAEQAATQANLARIERENAANQQYWTSRMAFEKNAMAQSVATQAAAQQKIRSMGLVQLDAIKEDELRTKSIKEKAAADQNQLWTNMGVRSNAQIEMQKKQVLDSYDALKTAAQGNHTELARLEYAKNEKLKRLNNEMTGHHEMSMASMTRAVLRFYAAWYIGSAALLTIKDLFMGGVKAIDDLKMNTIAVASIITTMQGTTGNVVENYRKNLVYANALNIKLMEIDANTAANYDQLQLMNRAAVSNGIIFDVTNKKQQESFTSISNTVAFLTKGQNQEMQYSQEINALMKGEVNSKNRVAQLIDNIVKQEGKYKDGLKEVIELGKKHGDTWERLLPYFSGINAASDDISHTWEAVSSSLQTAWGIAQRRMFAGFYEDVIDSGKKLVSWIKDGENALFKFWDRLIETKRTLEELSEMSPEGTGTAIASGILGKMLFGSTGAGIIIFELTMIAEQLAKIKAVRDFFSKTQEGPGVGLRPEDATNFIKYMQRNQVQTQGPEYGQFGYDAFGGPWASKFSVEHKSEIAANSYLPKLPPPGPTKEDMDYEKKLRERDLKGLIEGIEVQTKEYEDGLNERGKAADNAKKKEEDRIKYISDQEEKWREYEQKMHQELMQGYAGDEKKRIDLERQTYTDLRKSKEGYFDAEMELIRRGKKEREDAGLSDSLITAWVESQTNLATKKSLSDKIAAYDFAAGYETQAYDLRLEQIQDEADRIKDLTKDEAVARRYAANETDKAFIKMTRGSENFFAGTRAAFITLQEDAIRWGMVGTAVGATFKTSLGNVMGDAIYQIIKGGFNKDSLAAYAAVVADACLKSFTQKLGEMGSNYVTDALGKGWDALKEYISPASGTGGIWGSIKSGYETALTYMGGIKLTGEGGTFSTAWNAVSGIFSNDSGTGIWDELSSGFTTAYNSIVNSSTASSLIATIGAGWTALVTFISNLFTSDSGSGLFDMFSGMFDMGQARSGAWDLNDKFRTQYGPDGFAFVAHEGEMIIPKNESEAIREWLKESGYDPGFESLIGALDTEQMRNSFYEGTVKSWGMKALGSGVSGLLSGDWGKVFSGLNPANLLPAMFSGGFREIAIDTFGIDPWVANIGSFLGMGASNLLGLGTLGSAFLTPIGIGLTQGLAAVTGLESNSEFKSVLRDLYGTIEGQLVYAKYNSGEVQDIESMAPAFQPFNGWEFSDNYNSALALYQAGAASWPEYQASLLPQQVGIQARSDFFKNTEAGNKLAGYYSRFKDNFPLSTWEQYVAEGMGQYGMEYQNPLGWKPEFTFPQYMTGFSDSYLGASGTDYTAFYGPEMPTFTINPANWLFDGSATGMHQIPPYVSSVDYWENAINPGGYYGIGTMPTIIIDPGDYYNPPSYDNLGGMRIGGIASGPDSGYNMRLHGTEAVVPLPNGRSIPVDMGGSGERPIIHTHVYLDRKQIALAVGDELETNPRLKARYN